MSSVKIDKLRAVIRFGVKEHLSTLLIFVVWFRWNLVPNICTKYCLVVARIVRSCAGRTVCRATLWRFIRKERLCKVCAPLQVLNHLSCCLVYNRSAFRSCRIWDRQTDTNKGITTEMNSSSSRLYGTIWTVATSQISVYPPSPSQTETV